MQSWMRHIGDALFGHSKMRTSPVKSLENAKTPGYEERVKSRGLTQMSFYDEGLLQTVASPTVLLVLIARCYLCEAEGLWSLPLDRELVRRLLPSPSATMPHVELLCSLCLSKWGPKN